MKRMWGGAVALLFGVALATECVAESAPKGKKPLFVVVKMSARLTAKGHFESGAVADDDMTYTLRETAIYRVDDVAGGSGARLVSVKRNLLVTGSGQLDLGAGLPTPTWTYAPDDRDPNPHIAPVLNRDGSAGALTIRDFTTMFKMDSPVPQEGLNTPYPMAPNITKEMFRRTAVEHSSGPNRNSIEIPFVLSTDERKATETVHQVYDSDPAIDFPGTGTLTLDVVVLAGPRKCTISINTPRDDDKLIFKGGVPPVLEGTATATVSPEEYADFLEWVMPPISPHLSTAPQAAVGAEVRYRFEGMPPRNDAFGPVTWKAYLSVPGSECSQTTTPRLFYNREAQNDWSILPNWFAYWIQTTAAQGHGPFMKYDFELDEYAVYNGYAAPPRRDTKHIIIGSLRRFKFKVEPEPRVNLTGGEGIDAFAKVVRHEWCHRTNYMKWWAATGYEMPDPRDKDEDHIPDSIEKKLGFDPHKRQTLGGDVDDEEELCYREEEEWKAGSADKEDWGCPGKQCGEPR